MIVDSSFRPAPWLKNPHLQTLWAGLVRRQPELDYRRERLDLPDGDFVDVDWTLGDSGPIVVVLHGLTGSIESKYARGLMNAIHDRGWRAALMNFRGQSGEPNRLARGYHSGDTGDLDFLVKTLREREPETPLAVVGYSLGGNVTLKWMGEQGENAPVKTAVAVSPPFDLSISARAINSGLSRGYQNKLIGEMRKAAETKFANVEPPIELPDLKELRDFFSFDDAVTAPLHGFRDAAHYYEVSSCNRYLKDIRIPTLVLHAVDDPFMSPVIVPTERMLSDAVTLELSRYGGHVGFVSADRMGRPVYWLEQRIPEHLEQFLGTGHEGEGQDGEHTSETTT